MFAKTQPTEGLAFFRRVTAKPERGAIRRALACGDGTCLSVQAHKDAWSEPSDDEGPYYSVEVALDVEVPEWSALLDHSTPETDRRGWHWFYARVPLDDVERFAAAHGGIVAERG
jgi:hypothetical protein